MQNKYIAITDKVVKEAQYELKQYCYGTFSLSTDACEVIIEVIDRYLRMSRENETRSCVKNRIIREEETRSCVKNRIVNTPESKMLGEIAISLGMIVDILKADQEGKNNE